MFRVWFRSLDLFWAVLQPCYTKPPFNGSNPPAWSGCPKELSSMLNHWVTAAKFKCLRLKDGDDSRVNCPKMLSCFQCFWISQLLSLKDVQEGSKYPGPIKRFGETVLKIPRKVSMLRIHELKPFNSTSKAPKTPSHTFYGNMEYSVCVCIYIYIYSVMCIHIYIYIMV